MEDTSGLFPKDIHSFLRTFIPGSIFIIVFFCMVLIPDVKKGVTAEQLKNISATLALGLIVLVYIFGNIIAWISHVLLHRGFQRFTYGDSRILGYKLLQEEVKELTKILKKEKEDTKLEEKARTEQRRRMALLYDYFLHNEKGDSKNNEGSNTPINLKIHRERIFFIMSRIHAIFSSVVGIFIGIIIGGLWLWYRDGCLNEMSWAIVFLWVIIAGFIFLFYRILRNNVITYEQIFLRINRKEIKILNDRFHGRE